MIIWEFDMRRLFAAGLSGDLPAISKTWTKSDNTSSRLSYVVAHAHAAKLHQVHFFSVCSLNMHVWANMSHEDYYQVSSPILTIFWFIWACHRHREAREAKILSVIQSGAKTAYQVVSQAYQETPSAYWLAALSNVKLHIKHLKNLNQIPPVSTLFRGIYIRQHITTLAVLSIHLSVLHFQYIWITPFRQAQLCHLHSLSLALCTVHVNGCSRLFLCNDTFILTYIDDIVLTGLWLGGVWAKQQSTVSLTIFPCRCQSYVPEAVAICDGNLTCRKFISDCGCGRSGLLVHEEKMSPSSSHGPWTLLWSMWGCVVTRGWTEETYGVVLSHMTFLGACNYASKLLQDGFSEKK